VFDAGMSMARINLSHGTLKSNLKLINRFKMAKRLRPHKTCGLMLEARGREIRLSQVNDPSGELKIRSGTVVNLNCLNYLGVSDAKTFYCNCDIVQRYLKPNDVVYIDDGKVVGIVLEISNEGCMMEIKVGGNVRTNCQIRFIGGKHDKLNLINPKDMTDMAAISKEMQIDYLVLPIATCGEDIKQLREKLGEGGKSIKLLAKIDSISGVENYESILNEADGTIFQRNEL